MGLNLAEFQFLRPLWLAVWPLLALLLWAWRQRRAEPGAWQRAVDPHLLPHLLQRVEAQGTRTPSLLAMLVGTLAILALAGPSWRAQPQPLWQREAPLVIALDLSAAIRATDLKPSRLAQARAKINRLLSERSSGQVGLLAYSGHAFTVAPITRDARTVQALLDSLSPDVMPVEGQRVDRAIAHALKMLRAADATRGEILLLSDRSDAPGAEAAAQARAAGFRVSVVGVGTLAGAPLSGRKGFIVGADGQPQLARLDPASLAALAAAGGGRYAPLSADDSDLATLGVLTTATGSALAADGAPDPSRDGGTQGSARSDDGYWLLLALLPLALIGFRRGWLAMLPLVLGLALAAPPQAAYAESNTSSNTDTSSFWDSLWRRADQRAHDALVAGDASAARALAPEADLRAAAAFREKDYTAAAESWSGLDSADAHYNRGNALAQSGKLKEALDAYDAALTRSPGMEDAIANRKTVEDLLKQQQSQQQPSDQQKDGEKQDGEKQDGQQGKQGEQQQGEQPQGEQQQGEQQQGEQQKGEQPQGEQPQGEQPQGEQQQGEQPQGEQQQGEQQQGEQQQGEQQQGEPQAADEAERQAAEEAARREMQQALEAREAEQAEGEPAQAVQLTPEQRAEMEKRQANEQLLRRVPDDPGALLRRKFELEYQRRLREGEDR